MKKLLIATDCFVPRWDGISRFLLDIIPTLKEEFDITVVAPDYEGESAEPDVRIIRIPLVKGVHLGDFSPAAVKKKVIHDLVAEHDVVFTQTMAAISSVAMDCAHKLNKPHIAYIHSIDWQLVQRAMSKWNLLREPMHLFSKWYVLRKLNKADLIMVPSKEVREIMTWYGVRSQMQIITLGINTERFFPAPKAEAKKALGIDPSIPVIGYVGRLSREKSVETLYKAFMRILSDYPNAKLVIVGEGLSEIKQMLSSHSRIIMVGSQDNVVPYLQAMDMYVLPSLLETTSLSTLEAMACEIPVICTPVGLVKKYVAEKYNGLLFPRENELVLSLKIKWIIENPLKAELMGQRGRKTVLDQYDAAQMAHEIRDVLKKA